MNDRLLQRLRCSKCGDALKLVSYERDGSETMFGVLSSGCGAAFVVYRGVPLMRPTEGLPADFLARFGARLSADAPGLAALPPIDVNADFSFSFQWSTHAYDALTWEMDLADRVSVFYEYTGLNRAAAAATRMLDAGCGNGTLTAALAKEGFDVTGLDYSTSVYRAREAALRSYAGSPALDHLAFVQGDVWFPPFADGEFDLIYSDGVLHHTPNTRTAFLALAPKVRTGGRFFVWLYRADGSRAYRAKIAGVRAIQKVTRGWSHRAKWRLCLAGAAGIMTLTRVSHLFGRRRRRVIPLRLKALNLFDTISPDFDFEHTPDEVAKWYAEAGYVDVREATIERFRLGEGGFAMIGTRAARP